MKDSQKIQMLSDALRDCVQDLEQINLIHGGYKLAIDGAETALAMVEDDGAAEMLATLPEITPELKAAGAIAAKYGLSDGLSIAKACERIQEIAELLTKVNALEGSTNAS